MNDHLKTATNVPSASPFSFTISMPPTMNRLFTFALGVLLLAVFAVPNVHAQEDEEEDEEMDKSADRIEDANLSKGSDGGDAATATGNSGDGGQAGGEASGDDAVDAEFEEVDDNKK